MKEEEENIRKEIIEIIKGFLTQTIWTIAIVITILAITGNI